MAQRLEQTWFSIHRPEDQLHGTCCGPRLVRFCNLESWSWFDAIGLMKVLACARSYLCVCVCVCKHVCSNKLAVNHWHHPSISNHQHSVFSCVFKPYPSTMCSWEITLVIKQAYNLGSLKWTVFCKDDSRWSQKISKSLSHAQWHLLLCGFLRQSLVPVYNLCLFGMTWFI